MSQRERGGEERGTEKRRSWTNKTVTGAVNGGKNRLFNGGDRESDIPVTLRPHETVLDW